MKKILCLLLITIIGATVAYAQQNVTLTFTAQDADNHYVQLNRIAITNLTKGWQEIIYWPDTTLTMQNGTGIDDIDLPYKGNSIIQLSQNNPNPFSSATDVNLTLVEEGDVILQISDMSGKIVEKIHKSSLPLGTHQFQVYIATAGTYIMTAQQNGKFSTIKMVCTVGGNKDGIGYMGIIGANDYSPKSGSRSNTTQPFNFGDMMEYVGYATINGSEIESQRIMQAQGASQTFILQFAVAQYQPPIVITHEVSNIFANSATVGGNVSYDGGANVFDRGICYSELSAPTISNNCIHIGQGIGVFSDNLTGLSENTTYYVRAYAINTVGIAYGNEVSFTTSSDSTFQDGQPCPNVTTVIDYDGNTYNTVKIGNQCWMKENLRTTHYANGTSITLGDYSTSTTIAYYYDYSSSNIALGQRGYLYNWPAVMHGASSSYDSPSGVQGICPNGWHVPSLEEWTQLKNYVRSQSNYLCNGNHYHIAKSFASQIYWINDSGTCTVGNTPSTNNATGFSAIPAGLRHNEFYSIGSTAVFWSSSPYTIEMAYVSRLNASSPLMGSEEQYQHSGYSVRCLREILSNNNTNVTTDTVSNITSTTATCGGNVISDGGATVTARGVCWSTSQNPTIASYHIINGNGTGSFTSNITGLTAGTTYYVRAYAITGTGTAYGNEVSFSTTAPIQLPTVTTLTTSNISQTSATCGGNVTHDGGATVTARGICWSTSQNPTIAYDHTTNDSGTGIFTSSLTGLTAGTTYFVRAYATNTVGTAYGNEVSFTTEPIQLPTVTTLTTSNISQTSATCGGNVISDGGATVTERGVCWSISQNPTIAYNHTTNGSGTGIFTSYISGLTAGTTYYVRAYAINIMGVSYGNEMVFTTNSAPEQNGQPCPNAITITDYDGNTYNTVKIGSQCWMKENLRTTHYANGEYIALGSSTSDTTAYRYNPNNNSSNVSVYGYLYNWPALMYRANDSTITPSETQGICPTGWHVPSEEEWLQLMVYVGSFPHYQCNGNNINIAKSLASKTGWNSISYNCAVGDSQNDNNTTNFSAFPAGGRVDVAYNFGNTAYFWSSTAINNTASVRYHISYALPDVRSSSSFKFVGLSVRCLRNYSNTSATGTPSVTTSTVENINITYATCGGTVISDGGLPVTTRGVCWSTFPNPTTSDNHTTDGSGIGSFISNVTMLDAGTTYYLRAYATNSEGTFYGNEVTFITLSDVEQDGAPCLNLATITDYDNNTYNTVQIGNQCWLRENLRTTHYANGESISPGSTYSTINRYYYAPNNSESNVATYGYLYNWPAVMHIDNSSSTNPNGVRDICPLGWHVPNDIEWTQLENYIGNQSSYQCNGSSVNIAKAMASMTGWMNSDLSTCAVGNIQNDNNATGFSAIPAGQYLNNYDFFGKRACFWSTTPYSNNYAYMRIINYMFPYVDSYNVPMASGLSVRCIRNDLPTITTSTVENITTSSATCGGNVISDGGATVTARGVCWSTSPNPTIAGYHTTDSSGTGSFTSNITGLTLGITYYVRAYAINNMGTMYGNEVSFTTAITIQLPSITTSTIDNISQTSATCGGNITSDGEANVTVRGVCWGISQNPTIADNHTVDGSGIGSFSSNLIGLTPNTTYYVRAYATNNVGTAYGNEESFKSTLTQPCPGDTTLTDIDGNIYNTILIGNQCWMAENLRTTKYASNISIAQGSFIDSTQAFWYYPNNNPSNMLYYGLLYNWPALMHGASSSNTNPSGVQGICPNGWHVPSTAEWSQLFNYVRSQSEYRCGGEIAKALATVSGWNNSSTTCTVGNTPNTNNATGFSASPAGNYENNSSSNEFGNCANFWSTHTNGNAPWFCNIWYYDSEVGFSTSDKSKGKSVRCVKN